jgi:hypothetical protein
VTVVPVGVTIGPSRTRRGVIAVHGPPPPSPDAPLVSAQQRFEDAYLASGTAVLGYALRRSALLRLSVVGREYPGTIDELLEGLPPAAPTEPVTVQGQPGGLALVPGDTGTPASWTLLGQLPDGRFLRLLAPQELDRDQVLQIGGQVIATA